MPLSPDDFARIVLIGVAATAFMDAWLWLLRRLQVPTLDFALIGRWVGHVRRGRWRHVRIAQADPVRNELALGWFTHYAVGIAFAALATAVLGVQWTRAPHLPATLAVGVATVVFPWFVMQPAMGAGIAAANTPAPLANRVRSLANHAVFGLGMYLAAIVFH